VKADIAIENFRPGVMSRLGLDYAALSAANPRLIYVSISGFGQTGPRRLEPAMDLIVQSACGLKAVRASRCSSARGTSTAGMSRTAASS